ncbi:MAG: tetratricopeptide repeat protein [Phycisphaerae bacterium]
MSGLASHNPGGPKPASTARSTPQPPTCWSGRHFLTILLAICLLGGIFRALIVAQYVHHNPLAGSPRVDAGVYWDWAGVLAKGQWTLGTPFFSAPLYPYLLGVLRALGANLATIYVLQMLADLLTACLLASIGRRRFGPAVGLWSAGLFLLLLDCASFSLRVLTISLQLVLLAGTWRLMLAVQDRSTLGRRLALGFVLGLLCLSYGPAMVLVLALGGWLFWQSPRRRMDLFRAAVPVLLAAAVIAPATIHNWVTSNGDLFLIQAAVAINLRQGNQENSTGVYAAIPGTSHDRHDLFTACGRQYRQAKGEEGSLAEIDRFYRDQVFALWRSDPAHTVAMFFRKIYWFLTGRIYGDIYTPVLEKGYPFGSLLWLAPVHTAWLMGPALIGLVALLRRPIRFAPELLIFAIPLLLVGVFWYTPRYRVPAIPVIVVLASWMMVRAWHWRRSPAWSAATALSLGVALALGPINRSLGFDRAQDMIPTFEVSLGVLEEEQGDADAARRHYERALDCNPIDLYALNRLGTLTYKQGDVEAAIDYLRQAVAADPDNPQNHANLAKVSMGRYDDQAVLHFERALQLDPELWAVHADLARLCARTNRLELARRHFQVVLDKLPQQFGLRLELAALLARMGRDAEAIDQYRRVLASEPYLKPAQIQLFPLLVRAGRADEGVALLQKAVSIAPDDADLARTLAWFYATAPDAGQRNPAEAVRLAERANGIFHGTRVSDLDVLAAAYAAAGRFDEAVATLEKAIQLARSQRRQGQLAGLQHRLELYQAGKPFHWK